MKKKYRTGFSLAELLVSAAVLSILMSLAYQVLIEGLRSYRESDARLDCQRDAIKVLLFFNQEARESSYRSILAIPDNGIPNAVPGCVMGSARNPQGSLVFDSSGNPIWGKWICYARDGTKLMRFEKPSTAAAPQIVPELPGQAPSAFLANPPASRRQLSLLVKRFSVVRTTNASGVRSVQIELEMSALGGAVSTLIKNAAFPNP